MMDFCTLFIIQLTCWRSFSVDRSAIQKLGTETFEKVYEFLQRARKQNASENEIREYLEKMVSRASDCFEVDQLLYFEDQLKASEDASV